VCVNVLMAEACCARWGSRPAASQPCDWHCSTKGPSACMLQCSSTGDSQPGPTEGAPGVTTKCRLYDQYIPPPTPPPTSKGLEGVQQQPVAPLGHRGGRGVVHMRREAHVHALLHRCTNAAGQAIAQLGDGGGVHAHTPIHPARRLVAVVLRDEAGCGVKPVYVTVITGTASG
jgi:hypothetical protein